VERFSHLMKFWPVPNSYTKILPNAGTPGSFWEDRGDRNHCGIDIYAPRRSPVLAVDTGRVVEAGIFTSPVAVPYWNVTYYVLVQQEDGLVAKYAELDEAFVKEGIGREPERSSVLSVQFSTLMKSQEIPLLTSNS
jgi:murein DD-endopeptidase MepM/ murein hydrolase activator NlpD